MTREEGPRDWLWFAIRVLAIPMIAVGLLLIWLGYTQL